MSEFIKNAIVSHKDDDIGDYDEQVRKAQEIRLIEGSDFNNLVSVLMAITWSILVWGDLPTVILGIWLSMMVSLFLIGATIQNFGLYKKDHRYLSALSAKRWYLLAVILAATGWGVVAVIMFPHNEMDQIILAFILVGISASGISYSNVAWIYSAYVAFVLSPLAIRLFYISGEIYYTLSGMTFFLMGAIILAAYRINRSSSDALRLSLKNEDLIGNLTRASKDMENLNRSLTSEIEYVKNIEEELKKARDEAEKMSKTKGEFLANMSHEIRTPMNGVIGTLQLLEDTKLNDSQREYVNVAYKSADSLLSILNDILDLSKIEAGKLEFEAIPFDLSEIINDIVVLHALKAEQQGIYLKSEIGQAVPGRLIGDPTRVRQVLINLISNAIKFTSEGGVTIRVKLKLKDGKDALIRVEIEDTGVGVPKEKHEKLFLAFSQADGSTTRKHGGTGLGLTIVQQLVDMMKGNLGVDSEVGKGSKFWFVIPLGIAPEEEKPVVPKEEVKPVMLSGKVLLVEDNPVNQMVARKLLEKIGLESVLAENGKEALDELEKGVFDLVLMDCQMPEMDGFEATGVWREHEQTSYSGRLPIIAMTANVMQGDREKCLNSGMDDYLGKPVRLEELRSTLQRWIK